MSSAVTSSATASAPSILGRVKWFNNKAGYGFITVTDSDRAGSDIFVHHSGVRVDSEQYKYLVQGEYVTFKLDHTPGGAHEYQAGDVSGINGGKLMCETRREFRQTRVNYSKPADGVDAEVVQEVKPPRSSRPPTDAAAPRARGSGPREGSEWTMVAQGRGKDRVAPAGGRGRGRPPKVNKEAV